MTQPVKVSHKFQIVGSIKWVAAVIQLVGYGLTGLNVVPWNVSRSLLASSCGSPWA